MALQAIYSKKVFQFNFDARTSRGRMKDRTSWFIKVWDDKNPAVFGVGECAPLPGLSIDFTADYENVIANVISRVGEVNPGSAALLSDCVAIVPAGFPSVLFGLETALLDLKQGGKRVLFDNSFVQAKPIPINGLVWMGDLDQMLQQASIKIEAGFRCIKMKVGGLNFEKECDILHYIRRKYYREEITLRLDANGAFKPDDALFKLYDLSKFKIHSIEQPVKPGQPLMQELCAKTPIPIALDEELIGVESPEAKKALLERIKPQYIILKPSLHGGIRGTQQWIALAESMNIGWWITSALESNIGLNAICQLTASYPVAIPQGLGTGALYDNNIESPLEVVKGEIRYNPSLTWNLDGLFNG